MCCWSWLAKENVDYEMLGPAQFAAFLYPASATQPPIAQSALAYHGHDSDDTPTPSIPPNAARIAMATAGHLRTTGPERTHPP
jgi:hypothetical protein